MTRKLTGITSLLLLAWIAAILRAFISAGDTADYVLEAQHNAQNHISNEVDSFSARRPLVTLKEKEGLLSSVFGSNMVLQRDKDTILWGFSRPGTKVTTKILSDSSLRLAPENTFVTEADNDGVWRQMLPGQPASLKPIAIMFKFAGSPHESIVLENILFGDVYMCGGQSNMQFSMSATTNSTAEAKMADKYPHIRLFTVGQNYSSSTPVRDLQSIEQNWSVADSTSIQGNGGMGYFSSVCWFFGRTIADGLHNTVPIGLISSNWGGTRIERWSTRESLSSCNIREKDDEKTSLYNSMIHPFVVGPLALTGFIWYQGEANALDQQSATQYACLFPAMIEAWRSAFQHPKAFFGFIQLSTWCPPNPLSVPELRQAQMAAVSSRDTQMVGYATNADHGFGCNIHPPTKQPCGERLGRSALSMVYGSGNSTSWRSPTYRSSRVYLWQGTITLVVELNDVGELYVLPEAYNNERDGDFDCKEQPEGTCAWGAIKIMIDNKKSVWLNATATAFGSRMMLCAKLSDSRDAVMNYTSQINTIASSYGWGSVPMMTVYDSTTKLPVLPWNRTYETQLPLTITTPS